MNYIYFINSIKKVIFYMFLTGVLVFSVIAERQPLTNGDLNIHGTILNQYLNVSLTENGTIKGNESIIRVNNLTLYNKSISLNNYNQSISLDNYLQTGQSSSFTNGSDIIVRNLNVSFINDTSLSLFNKSISLDLYNKSISLINYITQAFFDSIPFWNKGNMTDYLGANSSIIRTGNLTLYNRSISLDNYNQSVSLNGYLQSASLGAFLTNNSPANITELIVGIGSDMLYITNHSDMVGFNATIIYNSFFFNKKLIVAGTLNATRLNGTLDCSNIIGGSDGDFCADATGSASVITNGSDANFTLLNTYKINGTETGLFNKSISLDNYNQSISLDFYYDTTGIGPPDKSSLDDFNYANNFSSIIVNSSILTNNNMSLFLTLSALDNNTLLRIGNITNIREGNYQLSNFTSNYALRLAEQFNFANNLSAILNNYPTITDAKNFLKNDTSVRFTRINLTGNITMQENNTINFANFSNGAVGFTQTWNGTCYIQKNLVSGNNVTIC